MPGVNPLLRRANVLVRSGRPAERPGWEYTVRKQEIAIGTRPRRSGMLTYVFFRSSGCRYDRRGECTMCNYGVAERVPGERMVASVARALGEESHYDALGISPFGNMFDTGEVPRDARTRILELAAATDCATFSCESRPETITDADLAECAALFGGRPIMVNLGLECADPWIQQNCVGKSLDRDAFRRCIGLLDEHRARGVANVLLGAPFLTEREAWVSAAGSMRWALDNGTYMCVLFPSNIKAWTLQEWLAGRGLYATPSLWSLVEAVHDLGPALAERVALSWYSTSVSDPLNPTQLSDPIVAIPTTCAACHASVVAELAAFNATADFGIVERLRGSTCPCRTAWLATVDREPALPLPDRVAAAYERIGTQLLGGSWWHDHGAAVLAELAEGSPVTAGVGH